MSTWADGWARGQGLKGDTYCALLSSPMMGTQHTGPPGVPFPFLPREGAAGMGKAKDAHGCACSYAMPCRPVCLCAQSVHERLPWPNEESKHVASLSRCGTHGGVGRLPTLCMCVHIHRCHGDGIRTPILKTPQGWEDPSCPPACTCQVDVKRGPAHVCVPSQAPQVCIGSHSVL